AMHQGRVLRDRRIWIDAVEGSERTAEHADRVRHVGAAADIQHTAAPLRYGLHLPAELAHEFIAMRARRQKRWRGRDCSFCLLFWLLASGLVLSFACKPGAISRSSPANCG